MKKRILPALGAALLMSISGTSFAASNPFSDVPDGHWAYDAVSQLASDGVINGYGDGTFRGDRNITRYEMAQMIAKAMAKTDVSARDKALIDKLAAEFRDELNNLGVRVAKLEKHADMVKWKGKLFYTYANKIEEDDGINEKTTVQAGTLRLEPSMEVNNHWSVNARIDYNFDVKADANAVDGSNAANPEIPTTRLRRAWAQGDYNNFQVLLGRLPYETFVDNGMIYDESLSGAQVTFGNKVKATLTAGRSKQFYSIMENDAAVSPTGSYQAIEIYNPREEKFTWGLGYHRWANRDALYAECGTSAINIYDIGLGYRFDKNVSLNGAYAWTRDPGHENESVGSSDPVSSEAKRAFSIELDYKEADPADKGSFGIFAAYRQLGHYAVIAPTYDAIPYGHRGLEVGVDYTFAKNLVGTAKYFIGKKMPDENGPGEHLQSSKVFYGELNFYF